MTRNLYGFTYIIPNSLPQLIIALVDLSCLCQFYSWAYFVVKQGSNVQEQSGIVHGRISGMVRNHSGMIRNRAWEDFWNGQESFRNDQESCMGGCPESSGIVRGRISGMVRN